MKEIKAIIQPFMLNKVIEALRTMPEELPGIIISHVQDYGRTHGQGFRRLPLTLWKQNKR